MIIKRASENYFYPYNAFNTPVRVDIDKYEDTDKLETAIDRQYLTFTVTSGVADGNFVVTPEGDKTKKLVEEIITAASAMSYFAKDDIVELLEVTQVNKIQEEWIDKDNDPEGLKPYTVVDNFIVTLAKRKANAPSELVDEVVILIMFCMRNGQDADGNQTVDFSIVVSNMFPEANLVAGADLDRVNWKKILEFIKKLFKFPKVILGN